MTAPRPSARSGQAAIEFTVGIFALLLALAAILVVGALGRGETDAMARAQARSAAKTIGAGLPDAFVPLADVSAGRDGRPLTPDDEPVAGSLGRVRTRTSAGLGLAEARRAVPGAAAPHAGRFESFAGGVSTDVFSFRRAEAEEEVGGLPPAAGLLGLSEGPIVQRAEVWMPTTGGL